MTIPLSLLEKAIRSQFALVPGTFICMERKRKGLAYTVFIGMAENYGYRPDTIRTYLKLDEQKYSRYLNIFEKNMDRVDDYEEMGKPINPDSVWGKIRNKVSLVESYIRFNHKENSHPCGWR